MAELSLSAFRTDFNLIEAPGFTESALFARMKVTPSGRNYDYFDNHARMRPLQYWPLLAWFDYMQGAQRYFNAGKYHEALVGALEKKKHSEWFEILPLAWLPEVTFNEASADLSSEWVGQGENPILVFRKPGGSRKFYFGAKGGQAKLPHGNMDAGSFIYELDGVRWAVDMGSQGYGPLEEVLGEELWNNEQDGGRWTLLTKNNHGHSTITINNDTILSTERPRLSKLLRLFRMTAKSKISSALKLFILDSVKILPSS